MTRKRMLAVAQAALATMIVAMALAVATPAHASEMRTAAAGSRTAPSTAPWLTPADASYQRTISALKDGGTIAFYPTHKGGWYMGERFRCDASKVTDLRSSDEGVVAVYKETDGKGIHISPQKAGRAKVSFSYKGRRRTVTVVVRKRYVNPAKSFKVGRKNFAKFFGSRDSRYTWQCGVRWDYYNGQRVSVRPKKGWKVVALCFAGVGKTTYAKNKYIKNGARAPRVSATRGYYTLFVTFENTANKGRLELSLHTNGAP